MRQLQAKPIEACILQQKCPHQPPLTIVVHSLKSGHDMRPPYAPQLHVLGVVVFHPNASFSVPAALNPATIPACF